VSTTKSHCLYMTLRTRMACYLHAGLLAFCACCSAQIRHRSPHKSWDVKSYENRDREWTKATWRESNLDDEHKARIRLDSLLGANKLTDKDIGAIRRIYEKAPKDRERVFELGYATGLVYYANPEHRTDLFVKDVIETAKPPFTYEFMRMRYIESRPLMKNNGYMIALAERLLAAHQSDPLIMHFLCRSLWPGNPLGRQKSVVYGKRLIEIDPTKPDGYADLASIYYLDYVRSRKKDLRAGQDALRLTQEYIKRENRPWAGQQLVRSRKAVKSLQRELSATDKSEWKRH